MLLSRSLSIGLVCFTLLACEGEQAKASRRKLSGEFLSTFGNAPKFHVLKSAEFNLGQTSWKFKNEAELDLMQRYLWKWCQQASSDDVRKYGWQSSNVGSFTITSKETSIIYDVHRSNILKTLFFVKIHEAGGGAASLIYFDLKTDYPNGMFRDNVAR